MQEVSSVCNLTKRRKGRQVGRKESKKVSRAGTSSVRPLSCSLRQSQAEESGWTSGGLHRASSPGAADTPLEKVW